MRKKLSGSAKSFVLKSSIGAPNLADSAIEKRLGLFTPTQLSPARMHVKIRTFSSGVRKTYRQIYRQKNPLEDDRRR